MILWGRRKHTFRNLLFLLLETGLNLSGQFIRRRQCLDQVLHVVVLASNQAAQVQHNAAGLVALTENGDIGVLESCELLPVPLTLPLEFFGNLLLQNKSEAKRS